MEKAGEKNVKITEEKIISVKITEKNKDKKKQITQTDEMWGMLKERKDKKKTEWKKKEKAWKKKVLKNKNKTQKEFIKQINKRHSAAFFKRNS